jgi:hypothetical protein
MPITYERDDERRLITVTVTEPYAVDDILGVIDRQAAEDTWHYAMLYDLRSPMSIPADSQQIANHVRAVGGGRERGPTGIAMSRQPEQFRRGLKYSELTRTIATVELLLTPAQVDDWLMRNARRRADRE